MEKSYSNFMSENAANAASVDLLEVCRSGNRKKCSKYFGTWFGEEPSKAVEAIEARLEMVTFWEQNLKTLHEKLKEDMDRKQKAMNILSKMSDEDLEIFLASKTA